MKPFTKKDLQDHTDRINAVYNDVLNRLNDAYHALGDALRTTPFEVPAIDYFYAQLRCLRAPEETQVANPFTPARLRMLQHIVQVGDFDPTCIRETRLCNPLVWAGALKRRRSKGGLTSVVYATALGKAIAKGTMEWTT